MEGGMPRRALALGPEWAQEHRAELMEDWQLCERNQPPQENPATGLTPAIQPRMQWRVTAVVALPFHKLSVCFVDGTQGVIDLSSLIHAPNAGVFAALVDPTLFAQVFVEHGVVTWPGEIDLAPDAMYWQNKRQSAPA